METDDVCKSWNIEIQLGSLNGNGGSTGVLNELDASCSNVLERVHKSKHPP